MSPWSPGQWQGPNETGGGVSCLSLWAMCHLERIKFLANVCNRATGDRRAGCWAGAALERADCPALLLVATDCAPEVSC